jgi:hypothetical protein
MTAVIARAAGPGASWLLDDIMTAPLNPRHPERICWGCDKYCPADDLACGNGTIRTPHPVELFGDDWVAWSDRRTSAPADEAAEAADEVTDARSA